MFLTLCGFFSGKCNCSPFTFLQSLTHRKLLLATTKSHITVTGSSSPLPKIGCRYIEKSSGRVGRKEQTQILIRGGILCFPVCVRAKNTVKTAWNTRRHLLFLSWPEKNVCVLLHLDYMWQDYHIQIYWPKREWIFWAGWLASTSFAHNK